jgi:sporulation protein YlmC with PRC-barrel domain
MKTSLICGAALAILGVAAAPLIAQTQTTTSSTSTGYVQTSKIIGTKVKTAQGEEVGVVKDVVLDRSNGCMAYTVLSAGGGGTRVTSQGKLVAVPWSVYTVSPDASYLTVSVERDRIYNAPVFEYSRIGDTAFTTSVYSAFGVAAGVGYSNTATTTGATTTTGTSAQTQSGAYASPSASPVTSASASPSASAAPTGSATTSPSATTSATAAATATASASPKSAKGARAKSSATPVSPRPKGNETMQGTSGESTSEGASATSGKKSTRKTPGEESTAETAASPSGKKSSHKKAPSEGAAPSATPGGEQE